MAKYVLKSIKTILEKNTNLDIVNDAGFFDIEKVFKLLNKNPLKDSVNLIITAQRGVGKSTCLWRWITDVYWPKTNWKWKVAYNRTSKTKADIAKAAFNVNYNGMFMTKEDIIVKYLTVVNKKTGKEKKVTDLNLLQELGRFVDLTTEANKRSGAGATNMMNYHLFFWDEFNEKSDNYIKNIYQKYLQLLSTIQRKNKPFSTILVGNKIDADNDIFVNLKLNTNNHDTTLDYLQIIEVEQVWDEDETKTIKTQFIYLDTGMSTFEKLCYDSAKDNESNNIVYALGGLDEKTNYFFNEGGFLNTPTSNNIIAYWEIKNKEPIMCFSLNEIVFEYGEFENGYYLHSTIKPNLSVPFIALDMIGNTISGSNQFKNKDKYKKIIKMIIYQLKSKQCFFTSFDLKHEFYNYINSISKIWDL